MKDRRDGIGEKIFEEGKSEEKRPKYVKPEIVTYSGDDLLKELGPASACTSPPFG